MTISPVDQVLVLQAPTAALVAGAPVSSGVISTETEASILASAYGVDPSQVATFGDAAAASSEQVISEWLTGEVSPAAPAPNDPTSLLMAYYTALDTSKSTFSTIA